MGYKSEIAIKCEFKAFNKFKKAYEKVNFKPDKVYKDGNIYLLYWEWEIWCEMFSDVNAIVTVMDKLDELQNPLDFSNTGYGYRFMRLGEEDTDVEIRGNDFKSELWLFRKIDIPNEFKELD